LQIDDRDIIIRAAGDVGARTVGLHQDAGRATSKLDPFDILARADVEYRQISAAQRGDECPFAVECELQAIGPHDVATFSVAGSTIARERSLFARTSSAVEGVLCAQRLPVPTHASMTIKAVLEFIRPLTKIEDLAPGLSRSHALPHHINTFPYENTIDSNAMRTYKPF